MIKNIFRISVLASLSVLFVNISYAQSLAPQSVNCSGVTMNQSQGSISFSVGELVVMTSSDIEGNTLGGGFINSFVISVTPLDIPDKEQIVLKVYPNPTSDMLIIQISQSTLKQYHVFVNDLQGKEVYKGQFSDIAKDIKLNLNGIPNGSYILSLKNNNNKVISSYIIIKQ